jgi:outer membrane lipoprotein-sorting protein
MRQLFSAAVAICVLQASAWATTGAEVLEAIDTKANKFEDQTILYDAVTTEGSKDPRHMTFEVILQGEKRLVEFSAPGDVRGTRVLVLKRNQMYIYLPAYNKVRRVASHVTGQGFMGTTFSDEDMSTSVYAPHYDAKITSEEGDGWSIDLTPKAETETPYGTLRMKVAKEGTQIREIAFYGKDGAHLKTESRSDYRCVGEVCSPARIEMVDHTRGNASSVLTMKEFSANEGVDSGLFSVRNLQRGD